MNISYAGRTLEIPDQRYAEQFVNESAIRDAYWLVEDGQVVIDVGCYIGTYTMSALMAGAKVYAVDPCEAYLNAVSWLAAENGLKHKDNLFLVNRALAGPEGYSDQLWAGTEATPWQDIMAHRGDPFTTLDELVTSRKMGRLDWVKIDVEGAELSVLRGAGATLDRLHPKLIIEDHSDVYPWVAAMDSAPQCLDLLARLGYWVDVVRYKDERTSTTDRDFWICR